MLAVARCGTRIGRHGTERANRLRRNFRLWLLGQYRVIRHRRRTRRERRDAFKPRIQLAILLLKVVDARLGRSELSLELKMPAPIFPGSSPGQALRLPGILRFGCQCGNDRGGVDLRERARGRQPLAALLVCASCRKCESAES